MSSISSREAFSAVGGLTVNAKRDLFAADRAIIRALEILELTIGKSKKICRHL